VTRSVLCAGTETTTTTAKRISIFRHSCAGMIKQYFVRDGGGGASVCVREPRAGWHRDEVVAVFHGRRRENSKNLFCPIPGAPACRKPRYYRLTRTSGTKNANFFLVKPFSPPPRSNASSRAATAGCNAAVTAGRWDLGQNRRAKLPAAAGDVPTSKRVPADSKKLCDLWRGGFGLLNGRYVDKRTPTILLLNVITIDFNFLFGPLVALRVCRFGTSVGVRLLFCVPPSSCGRR